MKKGLCLFLVLLLLALSLAACEKQVEKENLQEIQGDKVLEGQDEPLQKETEPVQEQATEGFEDTPGVFINGERLDQQQIEELTRVYGMAPLPGDYWYDDLSGAYGILYGPTLGYLFPGHDLGVLPSDSSNGNSGVFINGRELNDADAGDLEMVFGISDLQGRWWQDAEGNMGLEGDSTALVNLYLAYQNYLAQAQGGSTYDSGYDEPVYYDDTSYDDSVSYDASYDSAYYGDGGDNYWAGDFGSYGNEQDGFGYVMVDGASVTYGG